jgi:sugar/nucleoside kinase (ribokinase family)
MALSIILCAFRRAANSNQFRKYRVTQTSLDIVAIGNAIVDILAPASDDLLAELGLTKGGMQLVDADGAEALYARMVSAVEASGGSAANTIAGMAAIGQSCGFIGQVASDQFGKIFTHDIRANRVEFTTPAIGGDLPTGQCLIFVSRDDGQRTMNTFLGAAQHLGREALDRAMIERAAILYLEGYLWNADTSRAAMSEAIAIAKEAGRKVAFTLSEIFVILGHRADFREMMDKGQIDILFANEGELLCLMETEDFEGALMAAAAQVPTLVVTRGEHGATAVQNGVRATVAAEPVAKVVDTTGAGDLFAAGFLAGQAQGRSLEDSLTMGAVCAAEIISHFGPRAEADLAAMVKARLG